MFPIQRYKQTNIIQKERYENLANKTIQQSLFDLWSGLNEIEIK
jgi:hypothetical protein